MHLSEASESSVTFKALVSLASLACAQDLTSTLVQAARTSAECLFHNVEWLSDRESVCNVWKT